MAVDDGSGVASEGSFDAELVGGGDEPGSTADCARGVGHHGQHSSGVRLEVPTGGGAAVAFDAQLEKSGRAGPVEAVQGQVVA